MNIKKILKNIFSWNAWDQVIHGGTANATSSPNAIYSNSLGQGSSSQSYSYEAAFNLFAGTSWTCATGNAAQLAAKKINLSIPVATDGQKINAKTRFLPVKTRNGMKLRKISTKSSVVPMIDVRQNESEALQLLYKPNSVMTYFEFIYKIAVQLQLYGNVFIYIHYDTINKLEIPSEIVILNPSKISIVPLSDGYGVKNYKYKSSIIEKKNVIHIKMPSPGLDLWGLGPGEASWTDIILSYNKTKSDIALQRNLMRPDYFIRLNGASNEELIAFKSHAESILRGKENTGNIIAVNGESDIVPLNGQFKEIQLGEPLEVKSKICAAFKYPLQKLIGNDPIKANTKEAIRGWHEDLSTYQILIENGLSEILTRFPAINDGAILWFDPIYIEDRTELLQNLRSDFQAGLLSREEVRMANQQYYDSIGLSIDEI